MPTPASRVAFAALLATSSLGAQNLAPTPSIGQRYDRLLITNALVIDGAGNPTRGPFDILVEAGKIVSIQASTPQEFSGSTVPGRFFSCSGRCRR